MSKYHEIKNRHTMSIEEAREHRKSSISKMIEKAHENGEKLPDVILNSINFIEGFYLDYYVKTTELTYRVVEKITIAQNIMESLPFEYYKDYMDITWLKTFEDDSSRLINTLIYREQNDVVSHFLDLISQENKQDDFRQEIFEPLFNMTHHLFNLSERDKSYKAIKNYLNLFKKSLDVYEPFYLQMCDNYKIKPKELKKWHKNYEHLHILYKDNKLHEINLFLLKNDECLDMLKEIFNQYDSPKQNTLLTKEYFSEAIKFGSEKIVTYYISELLKHNIMTQEEIEFEIVKSFNEKITEITHNISDSFKESYKNDYSSTYNVENIYNIAIKYGNYKNDYKKLSELLLIDNKDFQNNFLSKILNEKNVILSGLSVNQWKHLGDMVDQIKELTGKGFTQSTKQRENRFPKEYNNFVNENPYEIVYKINRIKKLFKTKMSPLSEKELDKVYAVFKEEVNNKLLDPTFDIDKYRLNNKLQSKFEPKGKSKSSKI